MIIKIKNFDFYIKIYITFCKKKDLLVIIWLTIPS